MSTQAMERSAAHRVPLRVDAVVTAAAVVAAVGVWSFWTQVAGVDLVVHSGTGTRAIGIGSVLVTVLVVSALGTGLLRLLDAKSANGLRTWTIVAMSVFVVSLLGPLGAISVAAALALASLHASVALVLVVGLRQVRRTPTSAA